MSVRILLRDHPHRAIALLTSSHALVFRHSPSSSGESANGSMVSLQSLHSASLATNAVTPRCIVEFSKVDSVDLRDYRSMSSLPVQGTLGLITVNNDVFLCVVSGASRAASLRPGETVQRIHSVEFHCLNRSDYDHLLNDEINPYPTDTLSQDGFEYGQTQDRRDPVLEHPCLALKKLLSSGTFYYSTDFDLTSRLQDRSVDAPTFENANLDEGFLWNSYMIGPLVKFRSRLSAHEREALDSSRILTSAIRGFVMTTTLPASASPARTTRSGPPSTLTLISRLSCRRAGTRFNARGIDDDGNVANFVETETVFWSPSGICFSYVQIRGSVPVFWEQATGLLPGQQKIQLTRSAEATQPAFDKHFEGLEDAYGAVHVLNLLSQSKLSEIELSDRYRFHISRSTLNQSIGKEGGQDNRLLRETEFDFHAETKGPSGYEAASSVRRLIQGSADGFAYFLSEEVYDPRDMSGDPAMRRPHKISSVVLQQEGIFRTNCLDCLDRTNLIQTIISQMAIESFLGHRRERASPDFWMRHSALWADNGDSLSKIYAGTGALKSSFTRHGKMSFAGAIADARKSATRMYINNFADKGRQNTIDMLLGRLMGQIPVHLYDPVNDYTIAELNKRSSEFSSSQLIHIWVGTFNLNGRSHGVSEDLSPWLFASADMTPPPEIYAVGFQEIVELSPQQIMSTDPERRQAWETAVKKTLNRNAAQYGTDEYVLLRSGQLVGAALSIFVKASVLPNIKNVEGSVKKTGMSGMAGNKGAVAIRMDYANTQICFVTAHLAAGFANYEERNRDFRTISHGLKFQRNRSIEDHDTIIWLGDFNYRIGLSDEKVRRLIQVGDLDTLYENDQLNLQMVAGLTFPFYSEAKIGFNPTYKYDNGTDNYDTSEKARIPAWCDRILRKGDNLRQINYNAAPLRFSDHRPIYATFQCTISAINESLRETISHAIYEKRKEELGGSVTNGAIDDAEEEDLIGYNSIAPGLPPASSDRQKWWLENGVPARSTIKPPSDQFIPNPSRPSNPFAPATEEEWISKRDLVKPQSRSKASPSEDIKSPISTTTGAANPKHSLSPQRQTTRKAAPPIPKKPALLASREIGIINPAENTERIPETANNVTISSRDRSVNRTVDHDARIRSQGVNPLEMRPASLEHMRSRRESVPDGPPLPPRRKTVVHDASGLLDDDDIGIDSVGLWKPLQPQ